MRKVFLDDLPKRIYHGRKVFDWKNSVDSEVNFIYNEIKGVVKITDYYSKGKTAYLGIKYLDKDVKYIAISSFKIGSLGSILCEITRDFKVNIGDIFKDNKRDIVIIDRFYADTKYDYQIKSYIYRCNICGFNNGDMSEYDLLNGRGCSCCAGRTVVEGINDIPTTAPWMIPYFQGGYDEAKLYTRSSNKKIYPICPECGRISDNEVYINNLNKNRSIGCICSDKISFPEKFIFNLLSQLSIGFNYQLTNKTKKWCNKYRYDFYIENMTCIIEIHGEQHYNNTFSTIGGRTLEDEQENDRLKEQLAKENGIKHYIVLDCRKSELECIKKSVMESKLPILFNFTENDIDWNKCEEYALKNLVKEVCDFKQNNPEYTTTEIGLIYKLDRHTILKYLKTGTNVGWCVYDKEEEIKRQYNKAGEQAAYRCSKKVEVIKNGHSLGVFNSITSLSKLSNELFNTKFCDVYISQVCTGKLNTYKGYTFKFVN